MATSVDNRSHFSHRLPPAFPAVLPFAAANHHLFNSTHHNDDDDDEEDDPAWWKPYLPTHADITPTHPDPRDEFTADAWIPRNPTLIRLTGKHPFNSEPPLSALMHHGFLTPTPIHYVRNHGAVPRADWSTWTIDISGLVRSPAKITMDQLLHSFPSVDIPVTLVCAGNRRREQNMCRQTNGFNWGPAAVSTSVWRGVRLRDVLVRCGVMRRRDGALNVCFEGAEDLPGGGGSRYGTSLRREVAMDPARDVLLAYMQNGELLAPDHGFPVRVIIPGFIGGRMVKWLKRVMVTTAESDSYYHYRDNRVLPSHVDAELANAEAWWYKPEYIINELNINSVITTPGHDDVLPINSVTTQNPYTIKGYAYSGGGKKVTRVEITLDGGETWQVCTLDHPEKPTKYGKYWCWCFWSIDIEVLHLLGAKELAVRAWDESLNTQPEKLIWNLMGMMNNCWFRVRLSACRPRRGELGLLFEHPTLPGNLPGGWMARQKHLDVDSAASGGAPHPALKKSLSSPFMNTSPATFSISEVRRHSTSKSAWIVVHDNVYDCTGFLKDHPGGADSIVINAGSDCTEEFDAIHSDRARSLLDTYRIGELISTGYTSDASVHGGSSNSNLATIRELIALSDPREKVQIRLVEKTAVSRDVRRLRFALPSPEMTLGLPVGKHVFLCAYVDGKLCMRAYTPTSPADEVGCVELVIRVYFKGEDPRFPDGGVMSQYLESLDVGAMVEMKGPVGHVEYVGRGGFVVGGDDQRRVVRRVAAVAGGTGITPVYGVMQAVMRDQPGDETELSLVYACRTEEDIMLREELDGWVREGKGRVRVKYVVGRIGEEVMREHLPEGGDGETVALVCGPPGMVKEAVVPVLEKMKYDLGSSIVIF